MLLKSGVVFVFFVGWITLFVLLALGVEKCIHWGYEYVRRRRRGASVDRYARSRR